MVTVLKILMHTEITTKFGTLTRHFSKYLQYVRLVGIKSITLRLQYRQFFVTPQ